MWWVAHHLWHVWHVWLEVANILSLCWVSLVGLLLVLGDVGAGHAAAVTAWGLQARAVVRRHVIVDWRVGLPQRDGLALGMKGVPVEHVGRMGNRAMGTMGHWMVHLGLWVVDSWHRLLWSGFSPSLACVCMIVVGVCWAMVAWVWHVFAGWCLAAGSRRWWA